MQDLNKHRQPTEDQLISLVTEEDKEYYKG
jgi:hypothetical protein